MTLDKATVDGLKGLLGISTAPKEKEITAETVETDKEVISLPKGMTKLEGSIELKKQWKEEETVIDSVREYNTWAPDDVLVALKKVCEKTFGWVNAKTMETSRGSVLPMEIQIQSDLKNGVKLFETCIYGQFDVSPWEGAKCIVQTGWKQTFIKVSLKKKFRKRCNAFFDDIENHLKENSIYKGKALLFEKEQFTFIEPKINPIIILNSEEENVVEKFIINKLGKGGKKTVLLTGPYGTGKTETAMRIGAEAVSKGLTFVYCKQSSNFTELLTKMNNYQPGVIFMEDIDEIGGGSDRDTFMNNLLNTLDGVETKGNNLTIIFTTNHEKRINKALRRPGRIDQIVKFDLCTKETIAKIYTHYFKGMYGAINLDYNLLAEKTPIASGAVIAAIAQRAIDLVGKDLLTDEHVIAAISSMKYQISFMEEEIEVVQTPESKIVHTLVDMIAEVVH